MKPLSVCEKESFKQMFFRGGISFEPPSAYKLKIYLDEIFGEVLSKVKQNQKKKLIKNLVKKPCL